MRIHLPRGATGAAPVISNAGGVARCSSSKTSRVRSQARRLLQRSGYEVLEALMARMRGMADRQGDIVVVVTDVVMPMVGGVEMVATLRAVQPDLPVVFVRRHGGRAGSPASTIERRSSPPYTIDALRRDHRGGAELIGPRSIAGDARLTCGMSWTPPEQLDDATDEPSDDAAGASRSVHS